MSSSSSSLSSSPCAACKCLRRKCTQECAFAPYFPPDQPQRFANVHKVFGASNVAKLLNELNPLQREDAVNSLAYEAEARLRDPVYGCVGLISILQHRLKQLQGDLYNAKKELANYIGPSAMIPILQPPNYNNNNHPSSSAVAMPYNMGQMVGGVQAQAQAQVQAQVQAQAQLIEAQQLAAMASREDMEMMRHWEQQQPQQFLRFNGDGYEAAAAVVAGNVGVGGGGVGFSQIGVPPQAVATLPSLALGGPTFDHGNNNAYHLHHDQQEHVQIQLRPQEEVATQEPLMLLQQPEPLDQGQGHGGDQVVVAQTIPLQLQQAQHEYTQQLHLHLHLDRQHDNQPGNDQEGRSTIGPSC